MKVDYPPTPKSSAGEFTTPSVVVEEAPPKAIKQAKLGMGFSVLYEDRSQLVKLTRYSQHFIELDQKFKQGFPKSRPPLPPLEERKNLISRQYIRKKSNVGKLHDYLNRVVHDPRLRASKVFKEFLSLQQDGDSRHKKELSISEELSSDESLTTSLAATMGAKLTLEDFHLIKVIGKGCMGKVLLVREYATGKLLALKAISKEWVILHREVEHTKSERNILATVTSVQHPFLIRLHHSFQTNSQLFLVLDYYPGGDIATQLGKWHSFSPERSKFYAAEIVLGIQELHRLGIVYRDLKPENILIADDGHIVLTDFGLSKQLSNSNYQFNPPTTNTFCGTAEYLAPEVLRAEDYGFPVDWWSLGTLLYEMLTGITPFWAENHAHMYQRVLQDELEFPEELEESAVSFLTELLHRDPRKRLGANGAEEVKSHPYFADIDWERLYNKQVASPYAPPLSDEQDLSNFDETFLEMTPRLSPPNHHLSSSIQDCFSGYSFTANHPLQEKYPI
ncbi:kinase-like protein [Basidiobolus meristosporus CBS 931.73]|uniref:Kinase-like protein n=1 Tax=Basidiobolus meristosporus CBS 931.73 TaxID=1314790 RepID=A0A1Y1WU78_9FUNG|nr:kinase-like protein [Basidiobolus meristosporus CBS 931.73]|eukprot:ORX77097.1 kinase-like protein [Basidiobolus meristosporus CBS 931.73]